MYIRREVALKIRIDRPISELMYTLPIRRRSDLSIPPPIPQFMDSDSAMRLPTPTQAPTPITAYRVEPSRVAGCDAFDRCYLPAAGGYLEGCL